MKLAIVFLSVVAARSELYMRSFLHFVEKKLSIYFRSLRSLPISYTCGRLSGFMSRRELKYALYSKLLQAYAS